MGGHLLGNSCSLGKLYVRFVQVSICYFGCFPHGNLGGTLVLIAAAPGLCLLCQKDVIHGGLLPSVFPI